MHACVSLLFLSCLLLAVNATEFRDGIIFARSPIRNSRKRGNLFEADRKYDFKGNEGTVVLEGVGKQLQKEQQRGNKKAKEAVAEEDKAVQDYWKAIDLREESDRMPRFGALWTPEDRERENEVQRTRELVGVRYYQRWEARTDVKRTGQHVQGIGMVNKEMQKRMQRNFPPVQNWNPHHREKVRQLKAARKWEEAQRKLQEAGVPSTKAGGGRRPGRANSAPVGGVAVPDEADAVEKKDRKDLKRKLSATSPTELGPPHKKIKRV